MESHRWEAICGQSCNQGPLPLCHPLLPPIQWPQSKASRVLQRRLCNLISTLGTGEGNAGSGGVRLPYLLRGLRKATHRVGSTQGGGAGPLPTVASNADEGGMGTNGGGGLWHLPPSPLPPFKAPSLHFPATCTRWSLPPAQVLPSREGFGEVLQLAAGAGGRAAAAETVHWRGREM